MSDQAEITQDVRRMLKRAEKYDLQVEVVEAVLWSLTGPYLTYMEDRANKIRKAINSSLQDWDV